ncbi:MAG: hypothetical protein IJR19_09665 [Lachnospiraceae bacterium]|nr:hypothetical protein [Lachnospiraceae bacterium]MBQ7261614.1 hypothetical protein [Lachnospiraceae bacterium]
MKKRITAWIAAFVIVVAGLPLMPATVLADTTTKVDYVSRAWNETTKTVDDTKVEKQVCNIVTSSNTSWGSAGTETWYAVTEDVTISERVNVSGTVNLILCDGKKLTASKGIGAGPGQTFNIYGQSEDSGELIAKAACLYSPHENIGTSALACYDAAIGGTDGSCGTINIFGGKVNATASAIQNNNSTMFPDALSCAAGIGGGYNGDCGEISIYGGEVNAASTSESAYGETDSEGAGIGCGRNTLDDGMEFFTGRSPFMAER